VAGALIALLEPSRIWPHLLQNREPGAPLLPQEGQLRTNASPHWPQNLASSETAAWQVGHFIAPPIDLADQPPFRISGETGGSQQPAGRLQNIIVSISSMSPDKFGLRLHQFLS
jgi:hypothetical protein